MPYILKHYFDPDWDLTKLKPAEQVDGSVDHHEKHFVHSVEAGAVIAEWVELAEDANGQDERFVYDEKAFPAGRGTGIKHRHPDRLYAAKDGYVCYKDGKIVVRDTLILAKDIDYHTGNIDFIGNVVIDGSVRSGFSVRGRDLSVHGQIEGAEVKALQDLNCKGGIKGGHKAQVKSGRDMKLAFCENATLQSSRDILIKGALMHSDVYAGRRLAVGGRLTGGNISAYNYIYVGEQLGGGLDTDTSLVLGYHPSLLYVNRESNIRIKKLHDDIASFEKILNKDDEFQEEYKEKLESAKAELELIKSLKVQLWEGMYCTECLEECKVLVPGVVKPGVEISIGNAYYKVDDYLEDVFFYYDHEEVKIGASTKNIKR
ncbi:DUF342 domain-containing protein [Pseudodesulfovibrio sediminis]|uniref:DUF342 domain-containing protein n=1 Tax=Pseudodesulfovibrio sediminis TaxID=2810563 RepID=A0ABN6EM63_9BACT|nr:FapA family protein [Pseudodesulfovibrio sediminis]BCS87113.1 hypothetical protein PSDVSF_03550 [Pseudodesulfovibrio sediminis]